MFAILVFTLFLPYDGVHHYVDNATDFATALADIQNNYSSGTIYLAPGEYVISGENHIEVPTRIIGSGPDETRFVSSEAPTAIANDGVFNLDTTDFHLEACSFDQFPRSIVSFYTTAAMDSLEFVNNKVTHQYSPWVVVCAANKRPKKLLNCRLEDNEFQYIRSGILLTAEEDSANPPAPLTAPIVRNNRFLDLSGTAIQIGDGDGVMSGGSQVAANEIASGAVIHGNTIRNNLGTATNTYGIYVAGVNHIVRENTLENVHGPQEVYSIYLKAENSTISNNTVREFHTDSPSSYIAAGIIAKGRHEDEGTTNPSTLGQRNLIVGNRVTSVNHGDLCEGIASFNERVLIADNQVDVYGEGLKIHPKIDSSEDYLTSDDVTIIGNTIHSDGANGMELSSVFNRLKVHNNTVRSKNTGYAVRVSGGSSTADNYTLIITSNDFRNSGNSALRVDPDSLDEAYIADNILEGAAYGLRIYAASAGFQVVNNRIFGINSPEIISGSAAIFWRGNIGYLTQTEGTAVITAGNTSVSVTYDLDNNPTNPNITVVPTNPPTAGLGDLYVDNVNTGTSTFDINIGTSQSVDIEVKWSVR